MAVPVVMGDASELFKISLRSKWYCSCNEKFLDVIIRFQAPFDFSAVPNSITIFESDEWMLLSGFESVIGIGASFSSGVPPSDDDSEWSDSISSKHFRFKSATVGLSFI